MSFLSKKDVLASIKTRVQKNHGAYYTIFEAYFGTNPFTKKAVRKYAKSEKELRERIRVFYESLDRGGASEATLTPSEAYDAFQALLKLKKSNLKLTLEQCVNFVINAHAPNLRPDDAPAVAVHKQQNAMSIGEAHEKYTEAKSGKSEAYQRDIRFRVGKWVAAFGKDRPLADVTAAEVKKYLIDTYYKANEVESWVTYNNHLGSIKGFMSWCSDMEQGYLASNPVDGMKRIDIPYRQPEYVKAVDAQKLFAELWNRREVNSGGADLAYSILSFFCGMRQSEIDRVRLGDAAVKINLDERFIRVGLPKGVTKGIRPRTFTIPDQALAWMRAFDFMKHVTAYNPKFRRHITEAGERAGVTIPGNAGRHTFITMFEAVHHDQSALTAIVGNTEDVRAKSYNGVELKREGEAYFSILPPTRGEPCVSSR